MSWRRQTPVFTSDLVKLAHYTPHLRTYADRYLGLLPIEVLVQYSKQHPLLLTLGRFLEGLVQHHLQQHRHSFLF